MKAPCRAATWNQRQKQEGSARESSGRFCRIEERHAFIPPRLVVNDGTNNAPSLLRAAESVAGWGR